jgi:hypothetical protein
LDSDGDHFLFSPIFDRIPVSRDIDCYSLAKLVKSWRVRYFVDANICDVLCMASQYNKPVPCGRESAHKSKAVSGNSTLGGCMWRDQYLQGEVGEHQ